MIKLIRIRILVFHLLIMLIFPYNFRNADIINAQNCLPDEKYHRWIIADVTPAGLSNMLFGVYSYIPVALLYNVTGIIVGPMFSRRNFQQTYEEFVLEDFVELPFSYFFRCKSF